VDRILEIVNKYNVVSIPTMINFNIGEEKEVMAGFLSRKQLKRI
jgi:thiol:disulfide interchange protein